jgi:hypothetical protein
VSAFQTEGPDAPRCPTCNHPEHATARCQFHVGGVSWSYSSRSRCRCIDGYRTEEDAA